MPTFGDFVFSGQGRICRVGELRFDTFSEYLRFHRTQLDLTQQEFADKAGISQSYVSGLERGVNKDPEPDKLESIAKGLGRPPEEVFRAAGKVYSRAPRPDSPQSAILPSGRRVYIETPDGDPMDLSEEDLIRLDLELSLLEQRKKSR
jgi:transcriptional regulator with XRE-family HTH domain